MNDNKPATLKDFLIQYSAAHPESKRGKGSSKRMHEAALRAGFACTQAAVNGLRYKHGLGTRYELVSKAAKKRHAKSAATPGHRRRRSKYASPAAAYAAKIAAARVRRQLAAKKPSVIVPAGEPLEAPSPVATNGKASATERAFLTAIAHVGLERAKGLIARFEKQALA